MNATQMLAELAPLANWSGSDLTAEQLKDYTGLPEAIAEMCVKGIYDKHQAELKLWATTAKLEAEKKELLSNWMDEQDPITKGQCLALKTMGVAATGFETKGADGVKKLSGIKLSLKQAGAWFEFVQNQQVKLAQEFDAKHKPKKKGSGGSRSVWKGDIEITNTEETPDDNGPEHKYYFKGDEKAVWKKTTSTGATQKQKWKAVKHKRPMGGADSKPDDGFCSGAINWDKSGGSLAVKATGLSASQFKIRCGAEIFRDGFCDKCAKKQISFFTGTYKITRGSGQKFDGDTYKDFIAENLEYV